MINLHIEAVDGADLRRQLAELLGTATMTSSGSGNRIIDAASPAPAAEEPDAEKPATTRAPRKPKAGKEPEGNAPASEGTTASSDPATTPESTSQTSDSGQTASNTAASPSDTVSIEDIRELTLKVVDKCGKAGIEAVLEQFGVARATQVPEERRPELRDALQDALDAAVAA